jgi:hypothetical protein
VISCATTFGAGTPSGTFVARLLPATTSVRGLSFYSNGYMTVLGPAGWACSALVATDGGEVLDVYPPGKPDYTSTFGPKGAAVIQIVHEYTGHGPGAQTVCALFPNSAAASEVKPLPCAASAGEQTSNVTADIVKFTDPPGVGVSGAGSGGALTSAGAAVYPQLSFGGVASVDVSLLSCTLPKKSASLCPAILGDFLVRNQPSYTGTTSG